MTDNNTFVPPSQTGLAQEIESLRQRIAVLENDLQASRAAHALDHAGSARLAARLDALVRSSSEVRYTINADWTELDQLQGGGFIPDNATSNSNWLEEYIPPEHRELVRQEIARAIRLKDTYNIEHKVNRVDGSVGWALSRAVPLFDSNGEIESWMGAASDITDRKTSEEVLWLLNSELAHRMKNTLAIVQAIVTQTLRVTPSVDQARRLIGERLQALARAQDILGSNNFTAADVRDIVEAAVRPHQMSGGRVEIAGASYKLTAQQALGLSLSIHELATNAIKYGALSNDTGKVLIRWDRMDNSFVFEWLESGGPVVRAPESRSFGSALIEKVAASYFGGDGLIEFRAEGIHFRLTGMAATGEIVSADNLPRI